MTDQTAAQVDPLDAFVQEAIDQDSGQNEVETPATESAPVEDTKKPDATEANEPKGDEPKEDGIQSRINKITADKYNEKRRGDKLQKELEELRAKHTAEPLIEPTLEGHEYDTDAFNDANVKYQIQKGVKDELSNQRTIEDNQKLADAEQQLNDDFQQRIDTFDKKDFDEKAKAIPELPPGVASAMMQSEQGPEMIYHLGQNLDKADALAKMTPEAAMMELGKLSVQLSAKPEIKTSAAPDPIDPINSGSALSQEAGDDMSIADFMRKFG